MLNRKHTLEELVKLNHRVYIYLADRKIANEFIKHAVCEGFYFGTGINLAHGKQDSTMVLSDDKTFSFLNFEEFRTFRDQNESENMLTRIDYRKYIDGCDNYMYNAAGI